ncbi:hypothetical protein F5B20DRAFT_552327 [Whalleya microplaca]|nr:hypothetical protein F5B20DRAFT_552327 [Whalleya microplaca]
MRILFLPYPLVGINVSLCLFDLNFNFIAFFIKPLHLATSICYSILVYLCIYHNGVCSIIRQHVLHNISCSLSDDYAEI